MRSHLTHDFGIASRKKWHTQQVSFLTALNLAVEVMALHRTGQADEARRSLDEAKALIDTRSPVYDGGDTGDVWHDWLAAGLLVREAEALVAETAPTGR